jgi:hypothetical protein
MDDADEKPMVSIDPRYLLTGHVVERPADERPKHDTIGTTDEVPPDFATAYV